MKNLKTIVYIAFSILFFVTQGCESEKINTENPNNVNRGLPYNANAWLAQKSFTCKTRGYTISILRKNGWPNPASSPYKIRLEYHGIVYEHCRKSRRDNLANTHSSSPIFSSVKLTSNAQWGKYCDISNAWILGSVYYVGYPNSVRNLGPFTTNVYQNSTIHLDVNNINELVAIFNQQSSFSATACNDPICATWDNGSSTGDTLSSPGSNLSTADLIKHLDNMFDPIVIPHGNGGNSSGGLVLPNISDPDFLKENKNEN